MTNYDVIEAYVEDFTNWNYVKARGVATISQHKFIITECILKGLSIVEDIQEPYSNLTVRIIGITDNQEVLITDYVKVIAVTITMVNGIKKTQQLEFHLLYWGLLLNIL